MTIVRVAVAEDAEGIARVFLDSADHHARLDPGRYRVPLAEAISTRYRNGRQHGDAPDAAVTLVAERAGEVVGFVDARLERSPDPMHRDVVYCHVAEIAIAAACRSQGIGGRLLRAAEDWGRRHGAAFAAVEYHVANARAGSFYEQRMGYAVAARIAIKRLTGRDRRR